MNQVCVVIPIHKRFPTNNELISFQQCFKILFNHPIYVVAPKDLDLAIYKNHVADFNLIYIDARWQSSLANYNKLKLSRFFYRKFRKYKFLLTYELDAFVFKDDLQLWCEEDFDYIGAPWFENFTDATSNCQMIGVGNSGFSLRKVSSMEALIINASYVDLYTSPKGGRALLKSTLLFPFIRFYSLLGENVLIQRQDYIMEDLFLFYSAPKIRKDFRPAPIDKARKFSFEVNPKVLFAKNNFHLPFGCHAWWRYDLSFWKPFIERFGYFPE